MQEAYRYCYDTSNPGNGEYCDSDDYQESYCCGYNDASCCYYTNVAAIWCKLGMIYKITHQPI